jgi:hypothetical protein
MQTNAAIRMCLLMTEDVRGDVRVTTADQQGLVSVACMSQQWQRPLCVSSAANSNTLQAYWLKSVNNPLVKSVGSSTRSEQNTSTHFILVGCHGYTRAYTHRQAHLQRLLRTLLL